MFALYVTERLAVEFTIFTFCVEECILEEDFITLIIQVI